MNAASKLPAQPWWKFRIAWLVVALPLCAVLASFTSLYFAMRAPDPLVKVSAPAAEDRPAVEGRNHAATGGKKSASER